LPFIKYFQCLKICGVNKIIILFAYIIGPVEATGGNAHNKPCKYAVAY